MTGDAPPWTTEKLGDALKVTGTYIRRLCAKGEIRAHKLGKMWVIPDDEAQRLIEEERQRWNKF